MKRILSALFIAAALAGGVATSALAAPPRPDGLWQAISDTDNKPVAMIRVRTVDGQLQGWLTASLRGDDPNRLCVKCPGPRQNQKIIGMQVLWGVTPDPANPLHWTAGQILDPDSGGVYSADIVESPDGRTLTVRGYFAVIALGRTQTWNRAGP